MEEERYNIVEADQSDLGTHLARWARAWQFSFFILYTLVAVLSLGLYLLLARAVAMTSGSSPRSKETPVYFFLGLIAVTCLVEYALVVQQLVIVMDDFNAGIGTLACRIFTYFTYGNKLMQGLLVTCLCSYAFAAAEIKRTSFESNFRRYFPILILCLVLVQFSLAIVPTSNVVGGKRCMLIDSSYSTERATSWIYLIVLPFLLPLVLCLWPATKLALRIRSEELTDIQMSNTKVAVITTVSYFFFHLLYYLLMIGRESEAMVLDRANWRRLLGLHIWHITRPMFAVISFGWHVVVPLAPFCFDGDIMQYFPGNLVNRTIMGTTMERGRDEESRNSIAMSETPSPSNAGSSASTMRPVDSDRTPSTSTDQEERKLEFVSKKDTSSQFENPMTTVNLDNNMNKQAEEDNDSSTSFA